MLCDVDPAQLGAKIRDARTAQRYSVAAAAKAADMARDTWAKIEKGESVLDTRRRAALDLLGLDHDGNPKPTNPEYPFAQGAEHGHYVGPSPQDGAYVTDPFGDRVEGTDRDDRVLRAIEEMREEQRRTNERLARVEERLEGRE